MTYNNNSARWELTTISAVPIVAAFFSLWSSSDDVNLVIYSSPVNITLSLSSCALQKECEVLRSSAHLVPQLDYVPHASWGVASTY